MPSTPALTVGSASSVLMCLGCLMPRQVIGEVDSVSKATEDLTPEDLAEFPYTRAVVDEVRSKDTAASSNEQPALVLLVFMMEVSEASCLTVRRFPSAQALRMYPPAPGTGRVAKADAAIGSKGIRIPAGTSIVVNIMGMHFDPELFPDPEVTEDTADDVSMIPSAAGCPILKYLCDGSSATWEKSSFLALLSWP